MKLYAIPGCPYVERVKIYINLQEIGHKVDIHNIDLSNPPSDLLKVNPAGSVPTLIFDDGDGFGESLTIIEYLDNKFVPNSQKIISCQSETNAKTKALLALVSDNFLTHIQSVLYARGNAHKVEDSRYQLNSAFEFMETSLDKNKDMYFNRRLTFLDITLAPFLLRYTKLVELNNSLPAIEANTRLSAYIEKILTEPVVQKSTLSESELLPLVKKFGCPPPHLNKIIDAKRSLVDVAHIDCPASWTIGKSEKGPFLVKNLNFKNVRMAADAFQIIQQTCDTVDHHVELNVTDNTNFEIKICTHEPKWGISEKDLELASAFNILI